MECPNCGAQMGLEDEACPYCGTPNAQAAKHQSDMAHFRQEYQRTQADVMEKASFMQRNGGWLVVLAVLLVALVVGIVLNTYAWDIGYSIRESEVTRSAEEDARVLDGYLEAGDYGKFLGYYDANAISMNYDNPYQAVHWAASAYVNILEYIPAMHDELSHQFKPDNISDTCTYLAENFIRIFTLEQEFSYDADRYLLADKQVYIDDIRDRAAVIAKAYFGLTDEEVSEIPNVSKLRLGAMIEKGITS